MLEQCASRIVINNPNVIPKGSTTEDIRRDSIFCYVCCNLDAGSAYSLIPRNDIFFASTYSNEVKHRELGYEIPRWAGVERLDLATWQFTARAVDVKGAAEKGCKGCELLSKGVEVMGCDENGGTNISWFEDEKVDLQVLFCHDRVMRVYVVEKGLFDEEEEDYDDGDVIGLFSENKSTYLGRTLETFEFYTLPDQPSPWACVGSSMAFDDPETAGRHAHWDGGIASHVQADPLISAGSQLLEWVSTCNRFHSECRTVKPPSQHRMLPERLIHVGHDEYTVQLVEVDNVLSAMTEFEKHDLTYTALSHCWGKSQHLITTTATVEDRTKTIAWSALPKTFQDAVVVNRLLGIQYIWIDSLCIIQDSFSDWEEEAAKMGSIYNDAYLVISATGSIDGDGGCFFPRPGYHVINGVDAENGKEWQVYVRRERKHDAFGWRTTFHQMDMFQGPQQAHPDTYKQYPLFERAWCYQERMLGNRIVHFTKSEIVFECLTLQNCECGAMIEFSEDPMFEPRRVLGASQPSPEGLGHGFGFRDYFKIWRHAAVEYSRKDITRATDMLPALGGLASKWALVVKSRYLAGLWSDDILRGLLWYADTPEPNQNEDTYLAPSWSWVNVRRGVTWMEQAAGRSTQYHVEVHLERTECVKKGQYEYGELIGGWLFVTGLVVKATLVSIRGGHDNNPVGFVKTSNANGRKEPFFIDNASRCESYLQKEVLVLRYCTDVNDERTKLGFGRALVLGLANENIRHSQPTHPPKSDMGIYQRLGIVQYWNADDWDDELMQKASLCIV